MFAFSCDLPIYSLAYSPQLYVKIVIQNQTKSANLRKSEKERFFKIIITDFNSKSGSFILENQQLGAEENKIIDNAFFFAKNAFCRVEKALL